MTKSDRRYDNQKNRNKFCSFIRLNESGIANQTHENPKVLGIKMQHNHKTQKFVALALFTHHQLLYLL